jgi:hypothetical protein
MASDHSKRSQGLLHYSSGTLTDTLRMRLLAIHDNTTFPVRLSVDETEETIRILWEFVGHMGDDVGIDGYEFRLLERARHWAEALQAAMLAAIAHAGPRLIEDIRANQTLDKATSSPVN